METKDIFTIVLGATGTILSIVSLAISWHQRSVEGKRSTRKELTNVMSDLAQVELATNKLRLEHAQAVDESVVAFRRTYNSQRRFLANHGEFLAQEIDDLVTDIDCVFLARAFETSGDFERAALFYERSIDLSPNAMLRSNNLRGCARFWFARGNAAKGRKLYQEAVEQVVVDTDVARRNTAETYMLWARVEEEFGFDDQARSACQNALASAKRIAHERMREEIIGQIESSFER